MSKVVEKYDIYYMTDRKRLLRGNVSKEDTIKFLNSLTYAEKTHIHIVEVPEREEEEER